MDPDNTCQIAFFVIQAHHDHCAHDTLTTEEETLFHDWEGVCIGCAIARQYDPALASCPVIDCSDTTAAETNHAILAAQCADASACCATVEQQEAFHVMMAYHDICDHDDVPQYVEFAVHDYEAACEAHMCNAVSEYFDGTACAPAVVSAPIDIAGSWSDPYGSSLQISSTMYTSAYPGYDESHIEISYFDNAASFLVGLNSGPGNWNPGMWSRVDWIFDERGGLHVCTTHYDATDEAAAMLPHPDHDHALYATTGCGGFPFSALTRDLSETCGAGTSLNEVTSMCEISCDGLTSTGGRRLEEHNGSWEATTKSIVADYLAKNPQLAGKMDDEMREHMNKLGQLFGQPALA
jgi:hypothetical protein